ncbi:DNA sulfur modification protein DndB [Anaerovorax sp. IOR16]|uniref:DNA sulfur modification protein DndB n=1 Tax=Anaerovorax sp. IOR16 TaxID=2773458 RepID=UPI0019D1B81B|nr:DNA sulfur modification protein DndB [Anaerovorax sp. IOR16]
MLNENSKKDLIDIIKDKLIEAINSEFFDNIKNLLIQNDKFGREDFFKIVMYPETLYHIPLAELYWFAEAIEKVNPKIIKVTDYFTEHELKEFKTYVRDKIDVAKFLVLKNAFKLDENQWSCIASIEQIAMLRKHNIIRIDPNLQRQSKIVGEVDETGEILRKIKINHERVAEIEEAIVDGTYNYNTIRINLMDDGKFAPNVNKEGKIIIPIGADCIIPDGNHRTLAAEHAYFNHPELKSVFRNKYFQVVFTFYTAKRVKECISQEWNVEPVKKDHIESMKMTFANEVVNEIQRNENAERIYADKIVTTFWDNGFISYSILSKAIDKFYDANSFKLKKQAIDLAEWLIEYFNYLAEFFVDDFSDFRKARRYGRVSVNKNIWYGFVYLSMILRNNPNWKDATRNIIENMDWSRNNQISGNNTPDNIIKTFSQKVGELDV